ncbi:Uncharacterised protein [Bergeriella denitrificans]|uniref:Uncharacterized protein n=1 Tax=Bergeriella denitrificans TaxID=494 RepID=A0A378UIN5_BERDE|nr:Uncharacterised protein [Bergeriella denitrificans]
MKMNLKESIDKLVEVVSEKFNELKKQSAGDGKHRSRSEWRRRCSDK